MAKNKQRSGFDKFDRSKTTGADTIEKDEDGDVVEEPTAEFEPADDLPPVRQGPPAEAYQRLNEEQMQATTAAEQEAIIASHHPNIRDTMEDPAVHYKRALISGQQLPVFTPRANADPLLIECKDMFERVIAGGLVVPGMARDAMITLTAKLTINLSEKKDAQSDSGSAGR